MTFKEDAKTVLAIVISGAIGLSYLQIVGSSLRNDERIGKIEPAVSRLEKKVDNISKALSPVQLTIRHGNVDFTYYEINGTQAYTKIDGMPLSNYFNGLIILDKNKIIENLND